MNKQYDTIVFICRAQPLHNAHVEMLQRAAELTDRKSTRLNSSHIPLSRMPSSA